MRTPLCAPAFQAGVENSTIHRPERRCLTGPKLACYYPATSVAGSTARVRTDMASSYTTAVMCGPRASGGAFGTDNCAPGAEACRVKEGTS